MTSENRLMAMAAKKPARMVFAGQQIHQPSQSAATAGNQLAGAMDIEHQSESDTAGESTQAGQNILRIQISIRVRSLCENIPDAQAHSGPGSDTPWRSE